MPLVYAARQERQLEDLDREALVRDFSVRKATFNWPAPMYVVVSQLVTLASKEIGSVTRSEVVAGAVTNLGAAALSGGDLDSRLRLYHKNSVEDLIHDPIDPEVLETFPGHSGITLPEPVHILLKELQYASFSNPNQSDVAGMAVRELARAGETEPAETIAQYRGATVGDLFPR